MISYQELAQKPQLFTSLTGLSIDKFDQLFEKLVPVWVEYERERLSRPNRKRAIGGGRKYRLKLREQLLMVTCWLRLHLNTEATGFFFGVNKSTVSRNCRRLLEVLRSLQDETIDWPDPPRRGNGKSVEQALQDYADLLTIVNATQQRTQRPNDEKG